MGDVMATRNAATSLETELAPATLVTKATVSVLTDAKISTNVRRKMVDATRMPIVPTTMASGWVLC